MSRRPAPPAAAKAPAAKTAPSKPPTPVEVVGHTLERALDPLATALKRAALKRADKHSRPFESGPAADPAASGKPVRKAAMPVSPLAVRFPSMPPIPGVELATGRAGFYKHDR